LKIEFNSNCFDDELLHLFLEKPLSVSAARFGPFGNDGTHTLADLKPAFLDKVLNSFMRGVWVDFESGCQGSHGREGLPWLELAADKGLLGGENHLIHNRFTRLELKAERCHMDNVTAMTARVKRKTLFILGVFCGTSISTSPNCRFGSDFYW
jgi:hypothetical protein